MKQGREEAAWKVSVVIPAYNVGDYIGRAIDSVLVQSHRADEIIVVDDGSGDKTAEVVKGYGSKVRYIRQENLGASAARNRGIHSARNRWIAFLDGDDEWFAEKLGLQVALLRNNPELSWVSGNFIRCSRADKQFLGGGEQLYVIPNGFVGPDERSKHKQPGDYRLGFIGELGYGPNSDGLDWFGQQVWPLVRQKIPEARLRVVGRVPESASFLNYPGFEPLGFVPEVSKEFSTWSGMIVPMRYGGGTRIKIIEAFSRSCDGRDWILDSTK